MEKQELIKHVIEIDKYTEITLNIPQRLTAMELKGLMMKTNKLFSLSEIEMPTAKRAYNSGKKWTPEMEKFIMDNPDMSVIMVAKTLQERFGVQVAMQSIYGKRYELKKRSNVKTTNVKKVKMSSLPTGVGRGHSAWTEKSIEVFNKNRDMEASQILELIKKADPKTLLTAKRVRDRKYYTERKVQA